MGVGATAKAPQLARAQKGLRCRESYVVAPRGAFAAPGVSYRRLGEGPAWAGPGRLCACEISLRRESKRGLLRGPPLVAALAKELLEDLGTGKKQQ